MALFVILTAISIWILIWLWASGQSNDDFDDFRKDD